MEILTWVLAGALEHRDSLGTHGIIRPGEAQIMSAGTGLQHSEFNHSATEPVHFLQIWILPEAKELAPRYDQVHFDDVALRNTWCLIASGSGEGGSVKVFQDLRVFATRLDAGRELSTTLPEGRFGYLHVALGQVALEEGTHLEAGDALKVEAEAGLSLRAAAPSELLWFELA
jgi:redox-sensitive bicupin YhaK (pirin superfamily)